jgi:hypothetical protein
MRCAAIADALNLFSAILSCSDDNLSRKVLRCSALLLEVFLRACILMPIELAVTWKGATTSTILVVRVVKMFYLSLHTMLVIVFIYAINKAWKRDCWKGFKRNKI